MRSKPAQRRPKLSLVPGGAFSDAPFLPIKRVPATRHPPSIYLAALSQNSRRSQRASLEKIARLLSDGACDFWTMPWHLVRYEHTAALRAYLSDNSSAATAKRELAALRGTLKSAWRLELMTAEELARACDIEPVRGSTLPAGRALSSGEILALFAACGRDDSVTGARDAALLAVALGAGLRRFEIVELTLEDYNPETGALSVHRGKGAKGRMSYLGATARDAVNYWLEFRGKRPGALLQPLSRGGRILRRHLDPQSVMTVARRRGKEANLRSFSPHDLRRTWISNLFDNGIDIAIIQKLAGHASPVTTAAYDRRQEHVAQKASEGLFIPFSRPHRR
ncbi:MAG TPA: tyrosine-type recombinase/integrase [Abditibacterium sp.]